MAAVVAVFAGGLTMARSGAAPANDEMARISAFEVANDLSTARIVYAGRTIEVQLGFEADAYEPQTVEAQHGAFRIEYYPASVYDKQGVDSPGVVQLFSRLRRTQWDGRTLSLHETMLALSDVSAREQLVFTRLGTDGGWADAPYAAQDPAFRDALARYLSADTQLLELPLDQPEGT